MERQVVPAVSPVVELFGYSRAVRVGRHVFVAGTAPVMEDGADPPSDAYGQMRRCLEIVLAALAEVGARAEDVVRTRIFLTTLDAFEEVGRAHGDVFREIRPATAAVVVAALADPRWVVEIEADAIVPGQ